MGHGLCFSRWAIAVDKMTFLNGTRESKPGKSVADLKRDPTSFWSSAPPLHPSSPYFCYPSPGLRKNKASLSTGSVSADWTNSGAKIFEKRKMSSPY